MTQAYIYKWTHKPTLKWYVGFHSGINENYICSSKLIKHHIVNFPTQWERTIIDRGSVEDMYDLETLILQMFDAMHNIRSFNGHNNDKRFNTIGRTKEFMSEQELDRRSSANRGKPKSPEHKQKLSQALKGRPNPRLASTHGKGIPKRKDVCRISDRKEMNLSHFNQYIKRISCK